MRNFLVFAPRAFLSASMVFDLHQGGGDLLPVQTEGKSQKIAHGVVGILELVVQGFSRLVQPEDCSFASHGELPEGEPLDLPWMNSWKLPGRGLLGPIAGKSERSFHQSIFFSCGTVFNRLGQGESIF